MKTFSTLLLSATLSGLAGKAMSHAGHGAAALHGGATHPPVGPESLLVILALGLALAVGLAWSRK